MRGGRLAVWVIFMVAVGLMVYRLGAGNRLALALNEQHQADVVMYSASWCSVCRVTRQYLERRGQAYVELDIELDPAARAEFSQFGGVGIPLVLVKGQVFRGFKPDQMSRILDAAP